MKSVPDLACPYLQELPAIGTRFASLPFCGTGQTSAALLVQHPRQPMLQKSLGRFRNHNPGIHSKKEVFYAQMQNYRNKKHFNPELLAEYGKHPDAGPCQKFEEGWETIIDWDSYISLRIPDGFCAEAWHCISHYVYAALQGGSLMQTWMKDDHIMIASCNDGTRPVIFKLERIDD